jgi:hypothetical protein
MIEDDDHYLDYLREEREEREEREKIPFGRFDGIEWYGTGMTVNDFY